MPGRVVFFIQRGSFEPAFQTASMALTAAAMGDQVHIVLAWEALRAWVGGTFGRPASPLEHDEARRGEALGLPPPAQLLTEARTLGARLLACDTTVRLCDLDGEGARASLDDVTGLAALWRLTEGARVVTL